MITIANDSLPQTFLSYIAFRVAFFDTLERIILAQQFDGAYDKSFGFLTEVPFLQHVPPHVQLDLLVEAWQRHLSPEHHKATMLDEAIIYAICEATAKAVEDEPVMVKRFLKKGPMSVNLVVDHHLASELRSLHLKLSNEGDFLLISQFQDLPAEEALELKERFNFPIERAEVMFDILGRWYVGSEFGSNCAQLLSPEEIERSARVIGWKEHTSKEEVD